MSIKGWTDSSYLVRYILLNTVDVSDYELFPSREIQNAPPAFRFSQPDARETILPLLNQSIPLNTRRSQGDTANQFLERAGTTAFLVIKNDKLLFEGYYNGYDHGSICTSFSTVKSFVSALVGIALHDGLIANIDDPITKYLSELSGPHWPAINIRHLVSMSSGLKYNLNSFLPWDDEPRIYYTPNIRQLARQARRAEPPGLQFHYNNYNLVLLGMILERVTDGTVCKYLQEKIWKPLGMEFPASWSLDRRQCGMEKMESGLNARAIDFAKFGRLYLHGGSWNGKQIIPESWVVESTTIDPDTKWTNYKYLWWIPRSGNGRFMAVGNLGQFIYVAPDKDCIIIRFGRGKPRNWQQFYPQMFAALVELL
jgi:CubicO group peptidase (beta-lactamase class C family)